MYWGAVAGGAGDGAGVQVDSEVFFGEPTGRVAHRGGLGRHRVALVLQGLPRCGAAIGGVADHLGLVGVVGMVGEQVTDGVGIGGVGGGDGDLVYQLGLRVDTEVSFQCRVSRNAA